MVLLHQGTVLYCLSISMPPLVPQVLLDWMSPASAGTGQACLSHYSASGLDAAVVDVAGAVDVQGKGYRGHLRPRELPHTAAGAYGRVRGSVIAVAAGMMVPVVAARGRGVPAVRGAACGGGGSQSR